MRNRYLMCLVGLAFAASSTYAITAHAITADELVAKNLAARGGADKLHAIKTIKFEGKLLFGGQYELAYVQINKAPESMRTEATLQGLTIVQAWDGKDAWQIQPFGGRKDPEKQSGDDAKGLADNAPIGGPLDDWQKRGSKLEYLGTEDVDGTDAHKLKVSLKNGDTVLVYLDPDHFLEIREVSMRKVRGTEVEQVVDFGDYEKVDGVYFPFALESYARGDSGNRQQTTIDKAEANVPVDDKVFAFPAPAGAAK